MHPTVSEKRPRQILDTDVLEKYMPLGDDGSCCGFSAVISKTHRLCPLFADRGDR